jgi:hypothetical protein
MLMATKVGCQAESGRLHCFVETSWDKTRIAFPVYGVDMVALVT